MNARPLQVAPVPSLREGEPPEGFDPPTCSLRNCRSAGLSYGGMCVIAFIQRDWADAPASTGGPTWRRRKEKLQRHKDSEDIGRTRTTF